MVISGIFYFTPPESGLKVNDDTCWRPGCGNGMRDGENLFTAETAPRAPIKSPDTPVECIKWESGRRRVACLSTTDIF